MHIIYLLCHPIYWGNTLLKQIHYRHSKQGEEKDDYGTEGDDYPFHYFHDGGERGFGTLHIALRKVQSA